VIEEPSEAPRRGYKRGDAAAHRTLSEFESLEVAHC
jgi:hypothetical protein